MDKTKALAILVAMILIGITCFTIGRGTAAKAAVTKGETYQVYIYDNGSAIIEVDNASLITEGHSGLFVSNGR